MKKLMIFLSFSMMLLLVVGCHKENIRPNTTGQTISDNEKAMRNGGVNDGDNGKPGDFITDPNHDEDEDDKTRR